MKHPALTLLKVALAGVLVWFVIQQIETQDRLQLPAPTMGAAAEAPLLGNFSGDWRSVDWHFEAEDGRHFEGQLMSDATLLPGFFTALGSLEWNWFFLGVGLWGMLLLLAAQRWRILLNAAGVPVSYWESFRLTIIGYFFNNVMLGSTGGDLVRAVMVTRGLETNRMRAALSVIVDRLIGLFALMVIAGCVLTAFWHAHRIAEVSGLRMVTGSVYLLLVCAILGSAIYLSRRMRRRLGLDWFLGKLPAQGLIQKLDDAILIYRHRGRAVRSALLLSVPLQVAGILSFWAIGCALGSSLSAAENFVIFPVVQTASALPLAPAGWGVGETLYGTFFRSFGDSFTLGVAVSVLFRLTSQVGFGLLGGLIWVSSRERRQGISLPPKQS